MKPPLSNHGSSHASNRLGVGSVAIAAIALVVSGSTLVTDLTGFAGLGIGFVVSILIGLLIVIPVVFSASDLAISHPFAGGVYQFARAVVGGRTGQATGLFISLLFLGTFLIGATGETRSAASSLHDLLGSSIPPSWFAALILVCALIPNLSGIRRATWATGLLLAAMLGLRWLFGAAGFLGCAGGDGWSLSNLIPSGPLTLFGGNGMLVGGIALGFWCFVGIEGACSLVEETHDPRRTLPRGLLVGLGVILVTTLVMGIGVMGSLPHDMWLKITSGPDGNPVDAPHLAVGRALLGEPGLMAMAVASVASTMSTLLIALAAVPRMVAALARDGNIPGRIGRALGRLHPRNGVPVAATIAVSLLLFVLTQCCDRVLESLRVAAYFWFIRHLIVHVLAIANRARRTAMHGVMGSGKIIGIAAGGMALTATALITGYHGSHRIYLPQVLLLAGIAACAVVSSLYLRNSPDKRAARAIATG